MNKFISGISLVSTVLILSACGSTTQTSTLGTTDAATTTETATINASVITMRSGNMFFEPAAITAKKGETITINFENSGMHTFVIDELGVNVDLKGKKQGSIIFTPDKAGTFEFYCDVGDHRAAGMKGTLTVVE